MYRILPFCVLASCVLVSCGVFGLSTEERQLLASYKQRAQINYDDGKLTTAIDQAQKGLLIDANDYGLITIQGFSLLRLSGENPALLEQSRQHFERLMNMRSMSQQTHQALLGYGLCLERIGLVERQQVELLRNQLEHQILDEMERAQREASAGEHAALAESSFRNSRSVLERLLANGEQILLANKSLIEVNGLLPDYPAALRHGRAYLVESERLQEHWRAELQRTTVVDYEKEARTRLSQFRYEEIEVRALLANVHAKINNHAGVVEQLNVVLEMDPKRSIDYYNRGESLRELGRTAEMKGDFGTFLSLTNLPAGDPRVINAVRAVRGILQR